MRLVFILVLGLVAIACSNKTIKDSQTTRIEPLVNIQNPEEAVSFLCELLQNLSNPSLSDESYRIIQTNIDALYLGLEFGVNAGFYSDEKLIHIADSLGCLI